MKLALAAESAEAVCLAIEREDVGAGVDVKGTASDEIDIREGDERCGSR